MPDVEAFLIQSHVAAHEAGEEDVAGFVVQRWIDGDPFLLDSDGFEARGGGDGCYGAGVVGLYAADGDEVGAGLGEGVGDEVFEFADFVAAVGEAAGGDRMLVGFGEFGEVGLRYLLQSSLFAQIFTSPFGDNSLDRRGSNCTGEGPNKKFCFGMLLSFCT